MLLSVGSKAVPITVVTELFYPYQFMDENNQVTGVSTEILQALFEETGDSYNIEVLPWSVAYQKGLTVPNTMIYSLARNQYREAHFLWVGEIYDDRVYLWSLANSEIKEVKDILLLQDYKIAVVKDSNPHHIFLDMGFENLYLLTSTQSNLNRAQRIKMLLNGRIDLLVGSEIIMKASLNTLEFEPGKLKKVATSSELSNKLQIAFNQDSNRTLYQKYQRAYSQIKARGRVKEIKLKWGIAN